MLVCLTSEYHVRSMTEEINKDCKNSLWLLLVHSTVIPVAKARTWIFNIHVHVYVSGRTSCCKCSKCFYVYINIRSM